MNLFLNRVIQEKKIELAEKWECRSLKDLVRRIDSLPHRDFREALCGGGRIIAEVKKRSPSVPGFRQTASPEHIAKVYEANGACAISIVTDRKNFGTSLDDVTRVRRVVSLPVLVKDFIIDEYQIFEACAAGASAVLLIARILTAEKLKSLYELTRERKVAALVECHDEEDIDKAKAAGVDMVGINNRNLDSLEVSLDTTRKLIGLVPDKVLRVSESGIKTREDMESLTALGVDAMLIGSALLSSDDPGETLRGLLGTDGARK